MLGIIATIRSDINEETRDNSIPQGSTAKTGGVLPSWLLSMLQPYKLGLLRSELARIAADQENDRCLTIALAAAYLRANPAM